MIDLESPLAKPLSASITPSRAAIHFSATKNSPCQKQWVFVCAYVKQGAAAKAKTKSMTVKYMLRNIGCAHVKIQAGNKWQPSLVGNKLNKAIKRRPQPLHHLIYDSVIC